MRASLKKLKVLRFCRLNSTKTESATNTSREVAHTQQLFFTDPVSPGSVFFLPNGAKIFNKLVNFMKLQQQHKHGFQEVITPLIYKKSLWETSGHWVNYKDDMFKVEGQDATKEEYGLKPMNCPGHCCMFEKFDRSYHELPIRYSDFSPLHRNEASGALSGLTRVRKFHQDDGHIFCTPEQVEEEITKCLKLIEMCYTRVFQLAPVEKQIQPNNTNLDGNSNKSSPYSLTLSTRPEDKYIGNLDVWNMAESTLKTILEKTGKPFTINEGDGAFYGPKIDIRVTDHVGKQHQVATIQLDFQLPERFDLKYKDKDNTYKRPIMIHRAVFGSIERFMSMLIDSNQGKWPFWLNPQQAVIIPLNTKNEKIMETSQKLWEKLRNTSEVDDMEPVKLNSFHFSADIDDRAEPAGYRIKDAIMKNYSYLIIVGEKEIENGKFAIRTSTSRKLEHLSMDEIFNKFVSLEESYL